MLREMAPSVMEQQGGHSKGLGQEVVHHKERVPYLLFMLLQGRQDSLGQELVLLLVLQPPLPLPPLQLLLGSEGAIPVHRELGKVPPWTRG